MSTAICEDLRAIVDGSGLSRCPCCGSLSGNRGIDITGNPLVVGKCYGCPECAALMIWDGKNMRVPLNKAERELRRLRATSALAREMHDRITKNLIG